MDEAFSLLWAKSDTNDGHADFPSPHLLLGHMLDTAQVAGVLWDKHLAESTRRLIRTSAGRSDQHARQLVQFLAGVHDLGKASPAFQTKKPLLAKKLRQQTGADLCLQDFHAQAWHHTRAGGAAIAHLLSDTPWRPHVAWVRAVIGGHHGSYPEIGAYRVRSPLRPFHGQHRWEQWRHDALVWLLRELGIIAKSGSLNDLPDWLSVPPFATQLILAGLVIESDWIASDGRVMPGIWDLDQVTVANSLDRAREALTTLRFSPGWTLPNLDNLFSARFPFPPNPLQATTDAAVEEMSAPGLVIIEAPMGLGKTEAALVATERLARRFGAHGLFVGLPTQATTDAMFARIKTWLEKVQPGAALGLSHGKSMVNSDYAHLTRWHATEVGIESGCDIYSPSQWFSGRKRLLLSPHVVGTIDNILVAGAQIRHVALHHLAFAQKVIVLDEVHAADLYMSQFLERVLEWLGEANVAVILLSATLPPSMRRRLIRAYTGRDDDVSRAYPQITTCTSTTTKTHTPKISAADSKTIHLEVLDEPGLDGPDTTTADTAVASLIRNRLPDHGCVLIIRNTVKRAQNLYSTLRMELPDDQVLLLHSRFTAGTRANQTDELLSLLGDTAKGAHRPADHRLIVVATQVAEQSLDIDADLLITDLCPIDLLLQRSGRLHRHASNDRLRPNNLQQPTVIVTRMRNAFFAKKDRYFGLPAIPKGFIYPSALLARTAQILYRRTSLTLPSDVPDVIAEVYEDDHHRCDSLLWDGALEKWDADNEFADKLACVTASDAALPSPRGLDHLDGLTRFAQDPERVMVRDGDIPLEICLLRHGSGALLHAIGSDIAFHADGTVVGSLTDVEVGARVIASTVRISSKTLAVALYDQSPLPCWSEHPWLRHIRVLVLDTDGAATVPTDGDSIQLTYDDELGLSWK